MYRVAYLGSSLIAIGAFLPYKHVLYRDVNAFATYGAVMLVLAVIAAMFVANRRYVGAMYCSIGVFFLLLVDYIQMAKIGAFARLMVGAVNNASQGGTFAGPLGLSVHPDIGFYIIALGALLVASTPWLMRIKPPLSS